MKTIRFRFEKNATVKKVKKAMEGFEGVIIKRKDKSVDIYMTFNKHVPPVDKELSDQIKITTARGVGLSKIPNATGSFVDKRFEIRDGDKIFMVCGEMMNMQEVLKYSKEDLLKEKTE